MRVLEYTPLLAEDIAEVSTTKLITAAAAGSPARSNSITNGLLSGEMWLHEVTAIMVSIEHT